MAMLATFARKRLALWCYSAPTATNVPSVVREYSDVCDSLHLESNAPGGYGTLTFRLRLNNPWLRRPELEMFSRVALVGGLTYDFLGEIFEPKIGMDESGNYLQITALGIGNILRDDPHTDSYVTQTGKAIIQSQLTLRTATFQTYGGIISTDSSAIFPDNPGATFTTAYDNRTFEEELNDVCLLLGDYTWCVWDDPRQVDVAQFPLGRIEAHVRDATTTHYLATIKAQDVIGFEGGPSGDRAYNDVDIGFSSSSGGFDHRQYTDARLGGDLSQQSAPFRFRKFTRDFTGTQTVNATQAQQIANAYGAQMQNLTNKWTIRLKRIRDTTGNEINLADVRPDRNIFIPDFAVRSQQLQTAPNPGVNQFYIVRATMDEQTDGATLELECDNYHDRLETRVARLQLAADNKARSGKTTGGMVATGVAIGGLCSLGQSNATAGDKTWGSVDFGVTQLFQAPSSVGFTTISATNMTGVSATDLRAYGFSFSANAIAAGNCNARFNYTTSGNCLRAIRRTQLDWHCDRCGKEFTGLSVARDVRVIIHDDLPEPLRSRPGNVGLAIDCPECAATDHPYTESFNTALVAHDEDHTRHGNYHHRAEQAQLIRKLQQHGAIGLEVLT